MVPTDDHEGTRTRYVNGCRCVACRKAHADYLRAQRAKNRVLYETGHLGEISHGITGYSYYQCRCETCKGAARKVNSAEYRRSRIRRRIERDEYNDGSTDPNEESTGRSEGSQASRNDGQSEVSTSTVGLDRKRWDDA